jgi:hypothetical protein
MAQSGSSRVARERFAKWRIPEGWQDETSIRSGTAFAIIGAPEALTQANRGMNMDDGARAAAVAKAAAEKEEKATPEERGKVEHEAQSKHRAAQRRPRPVNPS